MASTFDIPGRDEVAPRPRTDVSSSVSTSEEASASAVTWAAIIAGALAATAVTVILLVVGTGVGISTVSPWYVAGASAATLGVSALIWLVVVQWISSGLGGFLAGRLRTKWVRLHAHEIFFRDTAHGFLAWSLASVAGALLFASATASTMSGVARGATPGTGDAFAYFTDILFRSANPADESNAGQSRSEATRILARSIQGGQVALAPADATYLAQIVAARTGLGPAEAQQRVDAVANQLNDAQQKLRQTADGARKQLARLSMVLALSMLIGAFIASAAAALGGRIRDEY
jgi:hypothetical protein